MTVDLELVGWERHALCRPDDMYPWLAEEQPGPIEIRDMQAICSECPVTARCAQRGLDDAKWAAGGVYAGVWLPPYSSKTGSADEARNIAVSLLQDRAHGFPVPSPFAGAAATVATRR